MATFLPFNGYKYITIGNTATFSFLNYGFCDSFRFETSKGLNNLWIYVLTITEYL